MYDSDEARFGGSHQPETGLIQQEIMEVVQKTLNYISEAVGQRSQSRTAELWRLRSQGAPGGVRRIPTLRLRHRRHPHAVGRHLQAGQRDAGGKSSSSRPNRPAGGVSPAAVWNVCPGFVIFTPSRCPSRTCGARTPASDVLERWRATARRYGFREYDGPPLEPLEPFTTKSGEEIVGQLYNFRDKGQREVSLRPEMTPTLARMIAAHERSYKKPIKWFALPQLFRYERQQKGRLREHFQFNADILGENDPAADAGVDRLDD